MDELVQTITDTEDKTLAARRVLEKAFGEDQVWNTEELRKDFEVESFLAPTVTVIRKSDQQKGTLEFTDRPRFYYNFVNWD